MKTLLIMRHAKSSWKDHDLPDHARPLNKRGQRDAPRMGRLIAEQGMQPDMLLSSTAERAQQTATLVVQGGSLHCPFQLLGELYLASPDTYLEVLRHQSDACQRILMIGHNPGLEELIALLTGSHESLSTATLVQLDFDITSWQQLAPSSRAQLRGLWRPRDLA